MASLDGSIDQKLKKYQSKNEERNVTLRTSNTLLTVRQNQEAEKRLSVFILWLKGSFTLEASLVLSLLLLTLYGMWYLFLAFHVQVVLQTAAEQTAQQAAIYAYAEDKALSGVEMEYEWAEALAEFAKWGIHVEGLKQGVFSSASREGIDSSCIEGGSGGIEFSESGILQEEGIVDVVLRYYVHVPIGLPGLQKLSFIQRSRRHAWIGDREGKAEQEGESGTQYYVAETGTVYHLYEDCSHIKLSIEGVFAGEVSECRNNSGGKYYPCEKCNRSGSCEGTVYIAKDGDRYHTSLGCSGLKRHVTAVPSESVHDGKICSRCKQRKEAEGR